MKTLNIKHLRCEYKKNPIGLESLNPRISWIIKSQERSIMQGAYQIQVSRENDKFENNIFDTGIIESEKSVNVEIKGIILVSRNRYYYRVCIWDTNGYCSDWSKTSFWEMGILNRNEWIAEFISPEVIGDTLKSQPCNMLRKKFNVIKKVKSVKVYATALGLYELYINGIKPDDTLFTPGWTSYNKRLQYQVYDVTKLINGGSNVIGILLGDGWYRGNLSWEDKRNTFGDKSAALVQLYITYADGLEEIVCSDESWKSSTGPILMSEIYHGETYDARLEKKGWCTEDYDDSNWAGTIKIEQSKEIVVPQENVPVRIIEKINPVEIITTPKGETVIDFGQNMVGWVHFSVEGTAGTEVILQHAEVLDRKGNFYTGNLRSAKQTIKYILKGIGKETYEPHFTFQGFRYVKVYGYPSNILLNNFCGMVIHSDMEETGYFNCSEELVNRLQHNIIWGEKGNFLDVPTDCPQRDERLGWTGDAQMFIRTACFNMNTAAFYSKWLRDLKADQSLDKGVPFVIPNVLDENSYSSSAWGDAAVICPWTIYLCYGDSRILEEQYESMKAWVEYIRKQGDNEYLWNTGSHFGDWLGLDGKENSYEGATSKDYIATAFYAYSTNILRQTTEILKKEEDTKVYNNLYANILYSFRKEFVTPNGRIAVPTQTAQVIALMFDLIEEKDKERVIKTLVEYIEENKNHLTTGFVGTPYICYVLSMNGYNDLAYKLLLQKDYPSWLYQITKGATTIWEHWDGIKEDGSFWSDDMNSFNHYAYGAIGDWLYRIVAGIEIDLKLPGYKHINIKPYPGQGLTYAEAELKSMYGEIKSLWRKSQTGMEVLVDIPSNTTATISLPFSKIEDIFESKIKLSEVKEIYKYKQLGNLVEVELGSGSYKFTYQILL